LYGAAAARAAATGVVGVLLGLYLAERGYGPARIGIIVGIGLAGSALGTAAVTAYGDRVGRRGALLLLGALGASGLLGMALANGLLALGVAAFVGMVNGVGRDRSPAQVLEQSVLADAVPAAGRTGAFTRYTFIQDVCAALGSLAIGAPALLFAHWGVSLALGYRAMFLLAAAVAAVPIALYARLPHALRSPGAGLPQQTRHAPIRRESARRVHALAALFALDSLGGGFLASAVLAYWFFRRFGLGGETLGPVFFAARALNALSYPCAGWLARRIGLIHTMVFTHLPSSAIMALLPLFSSPLLVIGLFLLREGLVQMDVPARQSYVAAVTAPSERAYALGLTGLVRNIGWMVGPPLAGTTMASFGLGAPLVLGAASKMVYDLALYRAFRHVPASEERRPIARA
jgi:MFS family permease